MACALPDCLINKCALCPYSNRRGCDRAMHSDALEAIEDLELQVSNQEEKIKQLESKLAESGRWLYDINAQDWGIGGFRCSKCDAVNKNLPSDNKIHPSWFAGSNFCPNCGIRMNGETHGD